MNEGPSRLKTGNIDSKSIIAIGVNGYRMKDTILLCFNLKAKEIIDNEAYAGKQIEIPKDFVLGPEHQRQYAEVNRQQHDRVIRACFIVVDASRLYKIVNLFT